MCETTGCCASGHSYHRRHLTNTERKERLQQYADDLAKELQAVNERIKALQ